MYRQHLPLSSSRSGELRTQKLKSHLLRAQSLKVLPLKPGVEQFIAIHAMITARSGNEGDVFTNFGALALVFDP